MYTREKSNQRSTRRRYPILFAIMVLILTAIGLFLLLGNGSSRNQDDSVKSTAFKKEGGASPDTAPGNTELPSWVTQDFLTVNEYSRPGTALKKVNGVVVHYTGNPGTTAKQNRDYFQSLSESGETSASSHFIIDTGGSVIQCIPLDEIAYCSNDRNSDTISIEVCHPDDSGEFTKASYGTLINLLSWLCGEYGLDRDDILRHSDVFSETLCPLYYMENPGEWEQLRDDVFSS